MRLLEKIGAEQMTTLIVVTHSDDVARTASRRVEMRDGKVVRDSGPDVRGRNSAGSTESRPTKE
jgi:putative ABC transport system ATP-binding protein